MRRLFRKKYISLYLACAIIFFLGGCEKKFNSIIDTTGQAPVITSLDFTVAANDSINTDTMNVGSVRSADDILNIHSVAYAKIVHPGGEQKIESVNYLINQTSSFTTIAGGTLHDDGAFPDTHAHDSIFSGMVTFQIHRADVGMYQAKFWSQSLGGYQSNTLILPIHVYRSNHPPQLSNLQADSIVSLEGTSHLLQLRITASDPDGLSDIVKVYFNSFKPNGAPSGLNPFSMFDDGDAGGISGDLVAGDGIYGLAVQLPASTTLGTYRFEFHAIDRSLDSSNVISRTVVVTQ